MKQNILILMMLSLALLFLPACYSARTSGTNRNVSAVGLKVPKKGVTIDASYDKRLDSLLPGYKVVTIALTNNSTDILKLNPLKDRWTIELASGRTYKAINSIRIKDPELFSRLPDQVKRLIDYPNGVAVGYTETFDVFLPRDIDLESFRSVAYFNANNNDNYEIVSIDQNDPRHQPAESNVDVPKSFPAEYKPYYSPDQLPTKGNFKKIKTAGK